MNILNHLTINNLKLNKKRTLVTIIGIMLSTALICAIAGMATSLQKTMLETTKQMTGDYHVEYKKVPLEELKYIKNNRHVASYYQTHELGYTKIKNNNEYKPYLYVVLYDEKALKDGAINVLEGRLPKNDKEILIPEHLYTYGFNKKIGDKIILNIGKRVSSNGEILNQDNPYYNYDPESDNKYNDEKIIDTKKYEYTIVGIMKRADYGIESYEAPGYYTVSYSNNIENVNNVDIFVKYKQPRKVMNYLCETTATNEKEEAKCLKNEGYEQKIDFNYNSSLLMWEGAVRSDNTRDVLFGIVAFVIGIVVLSSIMVIKNSFSISITERYKQYGMLSSIGATPKQIRKNVLFEGFILGLIGIPLGIILGVLADIILVNLVNFIVKDFIVTKANKLLYLSITVFPIIISIIISSLTILLSSLIPAIKVSRIPPLEAIRSSNDIKIKARKLRTTGLIKKIFGVGGEIANKNLKRNKKKYRTTIISIVVSIVIFISLSSFVEYGFKLSANYYQTFNYDVSVGAINYTSDIVDENEVYDEMLKIKELDGVKEYALAKILSVSIDKSYRTDNYLKYYTAGMSESDIKSWDKNNQLHVSLYYFNDEEYSRLTKGLHLTKEEKENGAILINRFIDDEGKKQKIANIKKGDDIKIMLKDNDKVDSVNIKVLDNANIEDSIYSEFYSLSFVVSKEFVLKHPDLFTNFHVSSLYLDCDDTTSIKKYISEFNSNSPNYDFNMMDYLEYARQMKAMVLIISIFLYGFIAVIALIGVTNIFNVITTNMMLRSKEFAILKAVGMTDKEFKHMIWLESILYGLKSLVIGLIIGIILSYKIYSIFEINYTYSYVPPYQAILISIIFVFVIIFITMRYSFNKINKQNIIDTIRNDNI